MIATLAALMFAAPMPTPLEATFRRIAAERPGEVGVAVLHLETGRAVALNGDRPARQHSVGKLPTAVVVLRQVEAGRLRLEDEIEVRPEHVTRGVAPERWTDVPKRLPLARLVDLSLGDSDNTAHARLVALAGGPQVVSRELRALGVPKMSARTDDPATPNAIVRLLRALHEGKLLGPAMTKHILAVMEASRVGPNRLKGALPPGTSVAHKTGTGERVTNDVGIIRLPDGRGHLAIAVFVAGVRTGDGPAGTIAALARAAYDHFTAAAR